MRRLIARPLFGGALLLVAVALGAGLLGRGLTAAQGANPAALPACPPATPLAAPTALAASPAATMAAAPEVATPTATGCQVTIDLVDIKFVPNDVTIPANTPVRFILHDGGALPHTFSITAHNNPKVKDLNINVSFTPGQTKEITIDAPAGDYYFYCMVPGHEAAGMHGMLHVK